MKNDPTFKLAALAILAGVITAFVTPAHTVDATQHESATPAAQSTPATE